MTEIKQNFVITIGREFGSGGREVGKKIANRLGIKYYDNELLLEAANDSGVDAKFFKNNDEKSPSFFDSLYTYNLGLGISSYLGSSSPISNDNIYKLQSQVIEKIAGNESCVIVGRTADYVLRNHPCCINVFLHADIESRVKRIKNRGDVENHDQALAIAAKRDKLRAAYYNYYTDKVWGRASSYDLTIDTSSIDIDEVVDIIVDYAKRRINAQATRSKQ